MSLRKIESEVGMWRGIIFVDKMLHIVLSSDIFSNFSNYGQASFKIPTKFIRGITRVCGTRGKKQNGTPTDPWSLIFLFTYFCQKVDPLKTCAAKSDKQKKGGKGISHTFKRTKSVHQIDESWTCH